jgi:hypothetical protein
VNPRIIRIAFPAAALAMVLLAPAVAPIRQGRLTAAVTHAAAGAQAGTIVCDRWIGAEYAYGALVVNCSPDKGGTPRNFTVMEGDSPSPTEVLAFVNPYAMAVKQVQVMPFSTGSSPISNWNTRVMIGYSAAGKITRIRYQTAS